VDGDAVYQRVFVLVTDDIAPPSFLIPFLQPYFQGLCLSPHALGDWFPLYERHTATVIVLHAPLLGLMLAFIIGTNGVTEAVNLPAYLMVGH